MTGTGRRCLYCSHQIAAADDVAMCDRCLTAHHDACWRRNGRCSTFRCPGVPLTLTGFQVASALRAAAAQSNANPRECLTCGSQVYPGALRGRLRLPGAREAVAGLLFETAPASGRKRHRSALARLGLMSRTASWPLPGCDVPCRSCGKCRRLYVWGIAAGSVDLQSADGNDDRYCPQCGDPLAQGRINLQQHGISQGVRFWCDGVPDLHRGWFGHQVLDRFLMNRWRVRVGVLPARSCRNCHYVEIAGHPLGPSA